MNNACRPEPQAKDPHLLSPLVQILRSAQDDKTPHVLSPQVQILRSAQDDKRVLSPLVILRSAHFDCAQCRQDDNHGC